MRPTAILAGVSGALLLAGSLHAQTPAEAPKSGWTLTANAGLLSDYRFRGFTQTDYKPSWQGGFDGTHASGFYVGSWNANVEPGLYRGATLEMDVYAGWKTTVAGLGVDFGALSFRYPTRAGTGTVGEVHHEEVYLGLSTRFATLKYARQLGNYFGVGDDTATGTRGGSYLDLGLAFELGGGWGLSGHFGHQAIPHATAFGFPANAVDDYKVGVTRDLQGWVLSVAWVGTGRKDFFPTGGSTPEAGGKDALVVGLTRSF